MLEEKKSTATLTAAAHKFGPVTTGGAAVAGADSGAGEEAPGQVCSWGFPGGSGRARLQRANNRG